MFIKLRTIIVAFCYITAIIEGLTIRELSAEDDKETTTATSTVTGIGYRKSVAKIKETPYRVPEHLQFVPKGFVYEDAADVIHVIDPPKQFEELKKIMQRQQQQRQLQNHRPIAMREQRPKPKIVQIMQQSKPRGEPALQRKPSVEHDLQTQESQNLPLEILASVRRTEKYIKKYKPKLPAVRQRLKTHKIQTVIWEQQQEQQQYQQGHKQHLQGITEKTDNRRRFNTKRFRRDATLSANPKSLEGVKLINHISELIKNATSYLQQAEEDEEDYSDTDIETITTTTTTTTVQPQVLANTIKNSLNSSLLNEDMIEKILENTVKATQGIMQQLKTQANLTTIAEKCDYLKVTYPNHIQNLQNQIKCMQNFIENLNQAQQYQHKQQQQQQLAATEQQLAKKYGDRLHSRKTKNLKPKPFIVAQLNEDYIDITAPSPLNSSLIYDDVMTTILNMLQTQSSQNNFNWKDGTSEISFAHDKSTEAVNFQNLHEYLTSLEAIVTNLPKFNHKSLNMQEVEGGSTSKYYFINPQGTIYSLPQPFQVDVTTTAPTTIFHQFPDLPIIREGLPNGSLLLPSSSKVVEIL